VKLTWVQHSNHSATELHSRCYLVFINVPYHTDRDTVHRAGRTEPGCSRLAERGWTSSLRQVLAPALPQLDGRRTWLVTLSPRHRRSAVASLSPGSRDLYSCCRRGCCYLPPRSRCYSLKTNSLHATPIRN